MQCFCITTYAYEKTVTIEESGTVSVYGGAAYVLTLEGSNSSDTPIEVVIKDENGDFLGNAVIRQTSGTVKAYSSPIVMPQATSTTGKVDVMAEITGAAQNIKLHFASDDMITYSVDEDDNLVLMGNNGGRQNATVTAYVLKDAEEYEYLNTSKQITAPVAVTAKKNSTWEMQIDTSSVQKYSTDVTVYLGGFTDLGYGFDGVALDFVYIRTKLTEAIVNSIKSAANAQAVLNILKPEDDDTQFPIMSIVGINTLAISEEECFDDFTFLAQYLYDNKAKLTKDNITSYAAQAFVFEALKAQNTMTAEKLCGYIEEYETALELTDEKYTPYSEYKALDADKKQAIITSIRNANTTGAVKTPAILKKQLANKTLNAVMNTKENYTGVLQVLENHKTYLGMQTTTTLSSTAGQSLADYAKTTDDITTIAQKRNELANIPVVTPRPSYTGGGSSSGGGGGGGGRVNANYTPVVSGSEASQSTPAPSQQENKKFSDLADNHWAKAYILDMSEKGILSGYADGTFKADNSITRAEFAKVAVNAFNLKSDGAASAFTDVTTDDWSYEAVSVLNALGIINGKSDKSFGKNDNITRQDMAVILSRIAKYKGMELTADALNFADSDKISDYAVESVGFMKNLGVISGTDENRFEPQGITTRAQAAKVIFAMMSLAN